MTADPTTYRRAIVDVLGIETSSATYDWPHSRHRYELTRLWDLARPAVFIGLNPSTATEEQDDRTIRRCIDFAKSWGCGGLVMLNLFAYRATKPADMKAAADPVGPENDKFIVAACRNAAVIVAAWGVHGVHMDRDHAVEALLTREGLSWGVLGLSKGGHPRHPLYMLGDCLPRDPATGDIVEIRPGA